PPAACCGRWCRWSVLQSPMPAEEAGDEGEDDVPEGQVPHDAAGLAGALAERAARGVENAHRPDAHALAGAGAAPGPDRAVDRAARADRGVAVAAADPCPDLHVPGAEEGPRLTGDRHRIRQRLQLRPAVPAESLLLRVLDPALRAQHR